MFNSTNSFSQWPRDVIAFDRRVDARYQLRADGGGQAARTGEESLPVRIINISVGGLALVSERHLERGMLLTLDLPSKDELGSRRLVMCVRSVEAQSSGSWNVGCEFARKLTALELLALL